ncbi:MAG: tape measure protein [Anaerolineae bacterium]
MAFGQTYAINIVVNGKENVSGMLNGVMGTLKHMGEVAGGMVLGSGILSSIGGIQGAVQTAVQSFASLERMGMTYQSLVAREVAAGQEMEKQVSTYVQLTAAESAKLQDLTLKRQLLVASINEETERRRQLALQYGEEGLNVKKLDAELAIQKNDLSDLDGEIGKIEAHNGKWITSMQTTTEGATSLSAAYGMAADKAKELMSWTRKLAIESPFSGEDVAQTFKLSMAYGFTSDQAKRVTQDLVDMSSGMGLTGDTMNQVAYAIGQINRSDKLLMQDLRQLMGAGVDVNGVLKKMGYSINDVGVASISSKKFVETFLQTMERDFKGAAAAQANSFTGLIASFGDILNYGLADVFKGIAPQIRGFLSDIVNALTSPEFIAGTVAFGAQIGRGIGGGIQFVKDAATQLKPVLNAVLGAFQLFQNNLAIGATPLQALSLALASILPANLYPNVMAVVNAFAALWAGMMQFGATAGPQLMAGFQNIGGFLTGTVLPALGSLATWLQTTGIPAVAQFAGWFSGTLLPALAQIGGNIATGALPALQQFADWMVSTGIPAVQQFGTWMMTVLLPPLQQLGGWVNGVVIPALIQFSTWLGQNIPVAAQALGAGIQQAGTILQGIGGAIAAGVGFFQSLFNVLFQVNRIVSGIVNYLLQFIAHLLGIDTSAKRVQDTLTMFGGILTFVGNAMLSFYSNQLKILVDAFSALGNILEEVKKWLDEIAAALSSIKIPGWAERHSPSPIEMTFMGAAYWLREMAAALPLVQSQLNQMQAPMFGMGSTSAGMAPTSTSGLGQSVHIGGPGGQTIRIGDISIQVGEGFNTNDPASLRRLAELLGNIFADKAAAIAALGL